MTVALGGVAVLAESRIVMEPSGMGLGEGQERPEHHPENLFRPAGLCITSCLHDETFFKKCRRCEIAN